MSPPAPSLPRAGPVLIAPRWRPLAIVLIAVGVVGGTVMSIAFHDKFLPSAFDRQLRSGLDRVLDNDVSAALLGTCDPILTTSLSVVIALLAAGLRRWRVFALTALGPVLAIVLTEVILKPLVGRQIAYITPAGVALLAPGGYAFPSGHETGLASLTIEAGILVLRAPISRRARAVGGAVLAVWTLTGALGLVYDGYHYATDTIGALCVSLACVLGVALLIDRFGDPVETWLRGRRSSAPRVN